MEMACDDEFASCAEEPTAPATSLRASLRPFVPGPPSDAGDDMSVGAPPAAAEDEAVSAASAKVVNGAPADAGVGAGVGAGAGWVS